MPIYEYLCANCGFEKEFLRKISDPLLTTCPQCQQDRLIKKVSAVAFQLKGTGWYATDFRSTSKASTGDTPKAADSATAAGTNSASPASEGASGSSTESEKTTSHSSGSGGCGAGA